ncbi:glutamine amidotransferase [Mixta tenebrionis]|uniref:Glutamine amidotransferase n=1 Tax=Mixta tenebrionis TaxID=2562439 RepID=A0A506VET5_9GAMM|nr:glutamine amidotransferase [Mixta tenebrionis]TPW44327.1 glutamine amidotransferase [Mixta tenebrionis]
MTSLPLPLVLLQLEVPPAPVRERIGEQARWFIDALGLSAPDYIICRPDLGEALPEFSAISGAILSGSWAMVTDHAEWSERTAAWVRAAMALSLPLLGVCYGHQLMAYALGGEVGDNPHGWERGALPVTLLPGAQSDALLAGLPSTFAAWLSHRQTVLAPPPGARVLARSAADECQIIRYGPCALSVQFHPEFNARIMQACQSAAAPSAAEAPPVTESARLILQRFWRSLQPRAQISA